MITSLLFDGDLGSGKTLSAVMSAFRWANSANVPILSNMSIEGGIKLNTGEDLYKIADFAERGSILLIDEAQSVLDSRTSQTKGQVKFTQFLQYLRKMRCLVIYTTPDYSMVDVRVRQRLSYRVHVSRLRGRMVWDYYEPSSDRYIRSRIIKPDKYKLFYDLYDTYEIVPVIELPTDLSAMLARVG